MTTPASTSTKQSKPDCSKGTACGYSCISKSDSCLDKLPAEAKTLVKRLISQLSGETRTAGAVVQPEELAELKANAEFLSKATPADIKQRAKQRGLQELQELGMDVSDEAMATMTDAIWSALPSTYRNKVKQKGGLLEQAYNPDTDSFGKPSDERGKQILRQYLDQNGRDAYTGMPIGLRTADLEHIVPIEKAGLEGDKPSNHVLTSAAVNQWKSAKDLSEWLAGDVAKRTVDDLAAAEAKAQAKKQKRSAAAEVMAEVDVASIADTDKYVDSLGKNYKTLSKLTDISLSFRYTRPATGKVGSGKLDDESGRALQKAGLAALKSGDTAALDKVKAARDSVAQLARQLRENKLSQADYDKLAAEALQKLLRN